MTPNLVVGCGYLGLRVARKWLAAGCQVLVTTRDPEKGRRLADEGLTPIVCDPNRPESLSGLPRVDTVLWAVGFDRQGPQSIHQVYVEGLRNTLDALPADCGRVIYISSTGVYSQTGGEWVDESSPCQPTREGGRACLAAEETLRQHPLGDRAVVLRMAGIYGPGRIPHRQAICAGEPIAAPHQGWLNLIHVDDAADVVLAAAQSEAPPGLMLISDGQPVQRDAYYRELARLLDAPPPQFVPPAPDAPAARRSAADKRIDNRLMREHLQVTLAYPSYREGLAAIVAGEK